MSDFITLACPSCAGNLQITSDADRFTCKYCGRGHIIRRQNGIITVAPIMEKLEKIASGVDRHASELAIPRLKREVRNLEDCIDDERRNIDRWLQWRGGKMTGAVIWICVLVPFGLLLSGCLAAVHWSLLIGCAIATFGLAALLIYRLFIRHGRVERTVTRCKLRIADLRRKLDRRRDELDRHRENVRI
ncbi:MAG TPA: hypothetical protein VHR66_33025 [Gemmataceae bacterium]|jgi:hypothetical protein|nr:hypothetical protein [Gemmataceae bacterium]